MEKFLIKGSSTKGVKGTIICSGAKNAVLPLMASSILFNNTITLSNVPLGANDIKTMIILLKSLGSEIEVFKKKKILKITNKKKHKLLVKYKFISTMRAGVLAMGALLGKYNKCSTALSGGCSLGPRPIDFHLSGFKKLNCKYNLKNGYINIIAKNGIKGAQYYFPKVSVTGTSNLILASVLGNGTTILKNISIEPEVLDLIKFLKNGGAKIYSTGKRTIKIHGVKKLIGHSHEVIGDRIEAFSYLCTAAITKGKIKINKIEPKNLQAELKILKNIGCDLKIHKSSIELSRKKNLLPANIKTSPFPGFATDCMPMLMAVLTRSNGLSRIEETIFSNRFMSAPELVRMGAKINIKGSKAIIIGKDILNAADCISSDLRSTFAIILGAMAANGTSCINRIYHGLRGYSNLYYNLKKIGVKIKKIS
jgi:UDP-N-acetylglucosamine 1-carboxyvinyltransferase|tara:strand:- start:302 stop:1570 length:1269 start_codon:yes stop_codon:yes gene_type:complete